MLSYFDSSVLLSILFHEQRQDEATEYWYGATDRVSSILFKIETLISLRRMHEQHKSKLPNNWLDEKTKELNEYLTEVNYMFIDDAFEKAISLNKELAKCRTLDAIHIGAALRFRERNKNENINFYSFDTNMHNLAKHFRFKTNKLG